jgi:hypothetical protein
MHPDLIPGGLIALVMLHLAYMGVKCHRAGCAFDPLSFLIFLPQAGMFFVFSVTNLPLEIRGFWVRLSALLIPAIIDAMLIAQYRRRRKSNE